MLDREVQRGILNKLAESYPAQTIPARQLEPDYGERPVIFNLAYLDEHGLTESTWSRPINGGPSPVMTKITAKGLDFISDDGGLSSILGIVTVKLHQDTITALMVDKIEKSNAEPSIKKQLVEKIKALPAEALQRVSLKALEAGLDRVDVSQWLDKLIGP